MIKLGFASVLSYLLGAIPTGFLIGKYLKGVNIQKAGSGNIGTANALKVLGFLPGILVFAGDVGKALLTLEIARRMGLSSDAQWWMGILAVVGHIFPVYLRFRGGKGLATGLGVIIWKEPLALPVFLLLWIFSYLKTKHVATSSVIAVTGVTVYFIMTGILPGIIGSLVIIGRHFPEAWAFITRERISGS